MNQILGENDLDPNPKSRLQHPTIAPPSRQGTRGSRETAGNANPLQRSNLRSQTLTKKLVHIEGEAGQSKQQQQRRTETRGRSLGAVTCLEENPHNCLTNIALEGGDSDSDGYLAEDNLFSVISVTGNGDVFLDVDYIRKGGMEDERVDLLLERIWNKYDWSSTDWPVLDPEETKMEEPDCHDRGSEADKSVDHTDVVPDEETSSVKVAGKGKRKFLDEGAQTRKKKVMCKRSAEKYLTFGPETKSFIEGLIRTSVTSLGDVLSMQMANMERVFTERMGKMEIDVSQLRDAISLTGEGNYPSKKEAEEAPLNSKAKQAPPKSKGAQAPPKSKGAQAPPKRKGDQPTPTKKDGKKIATETNDFDFGLSTQDLRDLSQATFVEGFDLSQVKVETSSKSKPLKMAPLQWNDEQDT
ncbi:hypothetical protein Bca52824_086450 [Brassica carinata]|uniref:Uncharacterized protein n=1 Tax=Brassica carinata TaxID=52824 RepID=A0A8X7PA53_BRACI|nr:hypothetical protein Bca52824_086450 [Brassica carinata]